MFKHTHPYAPYIPKETKKLIVGTLPPPRFTTGELKDGDVDFCYGSRDGQLWIILDRIFNLNLQFETTQEAIQQRKNFLKNNHIGICDMVDYALREKIDASDLGMKEVKLRNMIQILKENPSVETLLFTGGNSKNGPEYFFRKHIRDHKEIQLKKVSDEVPRIHQFNLDNRVITTVSLTAPSGAANRAVGGMQYYKYLKQKNPEMSTLDFRVLQYQPYFK
ncbi:G/U mismatch-specific uracil-DNA glycosylase [Mesonia phycicola]|uniref:G/U mismatch-specific uracil-DNA glycosylase n=1 Tax=Mesonia phycicola TaxID=579105 RepID=A0A1M6FDA1_9FLAO|nr:uracil-DNA glycosylase family protein [Mesonia phycicola]SHI95710.1 G/U mismatch-specific uracil-DNA glycosylase [Mesonia phycicola]